MTDLRFSSRFFRQGHYTLLLIGLLLYLFVMPPLVQVFPGLGVTLRVVLTFVFFAACHAVAVSRRAFRFAVALAVVAAVLTWISEVGLSGTLTHVAIVFTLAFLICTVLLLLQHVLGDAPITLDKLFGAICIYLLLCLVWASAYALTFELDPDAFAMSDGLRAQLAEEGAAATWSVFVYFSCVVLTTLGFGDMSPVGAVARSLVASEAVIGPLYLAILIARLVSVIDPRARINRPSAPCRRRPSRPRGCAVRARHPATCRTAS
jgi:hypothetical protein